ncbi:MAG TPA: glycosyltransferase family 2 protein [Alphaproteobacteria bacterium]|nr:glycosyltransferase family 2 protein [Rhodospirillaceae bacterium]HRJ11699.1 glycosyltransferase family 2 protein [Alphaproteobacteria bacterium]
MIPIAVVIMTKNEALRLPACLASLQNQFAEVFVVDSNSDDDTAEIARANGAVVVNFTWQRSYPKKKQWGMENLPATSDWMLYLDADERVTPELISELRELMRGNLDDYGAFWVAADPIWQGRRLRHGQSNNKICLKHRRRVQFPVIDDLDTPKNEVEGHYQPNVTGRTGVLKSRMTHDCDPITGWFRRHVHYAEVAAIMSQRNLAQHEIGFRARCKKLFYQLPLQGLIIFLYGYVWRLGFLDGRAGFDYAAARGWYYELTALFKRKI